jgi:hypothetical protein
MFSVLERISEHAVLEDKKRPWDSQKNTTNKTTASKLKDKIACCRR